jgi:hypothetical protein
MDDASRRTALEALDVFVGRWRIEAPALGENGAAFATFEWILDRTYLMQTSEIPVEGAPDSQSIIALDDGGEGFTQHYFDSRGVVRLYAMTFAHPHWTLTRDTADFSKLPFRQRWTSTFSPDHSTIEGRWERTDGPDGEWMVDFELTYRRVD